MMKKKMWFILVLSTYFFTLWLNLAANLHIICTEGSMKEKKQIYSGDELKTLVLFNMDPPFKKIKVL